MSISTSESKSSSHTVSNRKYKYEPLNEIVCLSEVDMDQIIQSHDFRILHDNLKIFYDENRDQNQREIELTNRFENFLYNNNINYIHDLCDYGSDVFKDLFNSRPNMCWNTTGGSRFDNYSCCPFYIKSIIELKRIKNYELKLKDYDQICSYLASVLQYSPGRKYVVGCLTNFTETFLFKAFFNENDIVYVKGLQRYTDYTSLQILTLFIRLKDNQLGYNDQIMRLVAANNLQFVSYLGRGSSSFVFMCNCNSQYQQKRFVLKIARKNCKKEKHIIEEMNKINRQNVNLLQCVNIDFGLENEDCAMATNLVGCKLDKDLRERFFNDTTLLIDAWKQINLCHKIGFAHSDIRIDNMIFGENSIYIIDYASAEKPNQQIDYHGCLTTASNGVLKNLSLNDNQKVKLYFTDDGISFIKTILLFKAYFKDYSKELHSDEALIDRSGNYALLVYEKAMQKNKGRNIIKALVFLEDNREKHTLTIDILNDIIIHTIENEKNEAYDIDNYLSMIKTFL